MPVGSNNATQTVTFWVCNVTFCRKDGNGHLQQLPRNTPDVDIMRADSATLKLTNQKNGLKGVCINHHANGYDYNCPVRSLGRRVIHIHQHALVDTTELCAYFQDEVRYDVTDKSIRRSLKFAGKQLNYPERSIPIDRIDTHSLRGRGANSLSLAGYSDRQIQKMGWWRSNIFKEYICDQLSHFSEGMSKNMKKVLNFVNIAGRVYYDVTKHASSAPYETGASAAQNW